MLLLGLFLVAPAPAQEPAPAPAEGLPDAAPPPVTSIGGGMVAWVEDRGSARLESGLVSLARAPDGGAWLLGLEDGSLWRSIDGARTWSRVLRAPAEREELDEEELLLEGESLAGDEREREDDAEDQSEDENAADETEASVVDGEGEASTVERGDAPRDVRDRAATDLDAINTDPLLGGAEGDRGAVVWFDPADGERALAGRGDGIWLSQDGGVTWSRVDGAADAWRFLSVPALGVVVAGTSAGVRISPDGGQRWFDTVDVTDGLRVDALAQLDGAILAGTRGGLYRSTDGLRWTRLPLADGVTALLPDPGWEGGLWVATPGGMLRSDDGGKTFTRLGRQVLQGLRGLGQLQGQGHILAWGSDGVWESLDGGVTWLSIFRGLRDPDVRDAVIVQDFPVVAATRSVWRLGMGGAGSAPGLGEALDQRARISDDEQALLGLLVDTTTRRAGLDLSPLRPAALGAKRWLPLLTLDVSHTRSAARDSNILLSDTLETGGQSWLVRGMACFGGCSTEGLYDLADAIDESAGVVDMGGMETLGVDELPEMLDEVYALGGEILGEGSEAYAATNSAQKMRKYRQQVADQVVGAWSTLQRIQRTVPPPSLAGKVARLLEIQEAEARLDLYTDGAYTRARHTESSP